MKHWKNEKNNMYVNQGMQGHSSVFHALIYCHLLLICIADTATLGKVPSHQAARSYSRWKWKPSARLLTGKIRKNKGNGHCPFLCCLQTVCDCGWQRWSFCVGYRCWAQYNCSNYIYRLIIRVFLCKIPPGLGSQIRSPLEDQTQSQADGDLKYFSGA